jgi:hypothetical protein
MIFPMAVTNVRKEFNRLLTLLEQTSFRKEDRLSAQDLLEYNEPGVALENMIDQLGEYKVKITPDIFAAVEAVAKKLRVKEERYNSLKELIA